MSTAAAEYGTGDYLYTHVTPIVLSDDMTFSEGAPRPGDPLPRFDLPTADGARVRADDFRGKRPLLLITGSFTCPMTASSNPKLKRLHARFGSQIAFLMLHVREAHPGERYDQPRSFDEKLEHARDLKERDRLPWTIAVDDPAGSVHRALDEKPNAIYLANQDGEIVYRALWAGDEEGLTQALESVARGKRPRQQESRRRLLPMAEGVGVMRAMMRRSGPRAEADIWRAAPPMAAMAWIADLYHPLQPKWRTVAAAATIGIAAVVGVSLLARAISRR